MIKLFRKITDRILPRRNKGNMFYNVEFGVYHDEVLVTRFTLVLKANGYAHASHIVDKYIDVRKISIQRKRS